jgi:hypothetical protein
MQRKANSAQAAIYVVDSIARHLRHPLFGRMSGDSSDGDSSRLQVQKEQDIATLQSASSEHFHGKEINARQDSHVGANEVSPVHLLSTLGCPAWLPEPLAGEPDVRDVCRFRPA